MNAICQTPKRFTDNPRNEQYRATIKQLRKKIANLEKKLQKAEEPKKIDDLTLEEFLSVVDRFFPPNIASFVKSQAKLCSKKKYGNRYSKEFKSFCLNIHLSSPKCYRFLSNIFRFPSPRLLQLSVQHVQILPGLQTVVMEQYLRSKIRSLASLEKFCMLCIDEASIKSNLFYMINRDEVIGFEDYGDGQKSFAPANHVAVIMIRGIMSRWKQPLAYFFLNQSFNTNKAKAIILDLIYNLQTIGFTILSLTTDMGSDLRKITKELGVTADEGFFEVNSQKIFCFIDPPHVLKGSRNNFFSNKIFVDDVHISKDWVLRIYEEDKMRAYKLAPKLTENHINFDNFKKMNVSLAAQVFSNTVASAIKTKVSTKAFPDEALATTTFIEYMDKLFDIFNSRVEGGKKEFNAPFSYTSNQSAFLNSAKEYLRSISVKNKLGADITNKIFSYKAWIHNINSLQQLWQYIQEKYPEIRYLAMNRFNQDPIENYFGKVRSSNGNARNPTPIQFYQTFRKSFSIDLCHSLETGNNCTPDGDESLFNFSDTCNIPVFSESHFVQSNEGPHLINSHDYRHMDIGEQNSFIYTCGYYIRKCLSEHTCNVCQEYADANKSEVVNRNSQFYSHFRAYISSVDNAFGNLYMPHDDFIIYIKKLDEKFTENVQELILSRYVIANILTHLAEVEFTHPCPNFPKSFILRLFARVKLYYLLKFINQTFKTQSGHAKVVIFQHE